jgi:hypothetical protein
MLEAKISHALELADELPTYSKTIEADRRKS